jgi:predicted neuraminidase
MISLLRFAPLCLMLALIWRSGIVSAADPGCRIVDMFPPQPKHVHSSSIVELADGSLASCWFYGSGERKAADVVVQGARLKSGAAGWTAPFLMADTPEFPDCNPVLYVDRQERLWLFWVCVLAERWECAQLKYRRADDPLGDGPPAWTWQDVIQLKPGDAFAQTLRERFDELDQEEGMWAAYALPYRELLEQAAADPAKRQMGWMTRTHPLALPSGRLLLPLYSDGFNASLMAISDDDGQTWRAGSPIVGLGPIQPTVARRRDGTLAAFCRDSGDRPYRVLAATSSDDGVTWTAARDIDVPNPGSSLEVIVLQDGRWLMACNDTEEERDRLSLLVSEDEGRTWPLRRRLEPSDDRGRSFGYPSLLQTRDGQIHVTYTTAGTDGNTIRHAVIDPQWLPTAAR